MKQSNALKIDTVTRDGIELITIEGFLDAHTAPILEKHIETLVNSNRIRIIIDFSALEYISSAGLGVFMSHIEEIRNKGGDIKMIKMTDKVYSVFDLLGFPMLFNLEKNEEEAIFKFNNNIIGGSD